MAHSSANFDQKRVTFCEKKCKNGGPPLRTDGRTDGNQPAASDPASTQGILIPWDSEGLATPLQQIKRNGRLREGFRVLRCRILAGRGPTVSENPVLKSAIRARRMEIGLQLKRNRNERVPNHKNRGTHFFVIWSEKNHIFWAPAPPTFAPEPGRAWLSSAELGRGWPNSNIKRNSMNFIGNRRKFIES